MSETTVTPEEKEEEARKTLEAANDLRKEKCLAKIEAACKEYGITLVPQLVIIGGQIVDHSIHLNVVGKPNEVA